MLEAAENNAFTQQQINEEMRRRLPNSPQVCVYMYTFISSSSRFVAERNSERVKVERYATDASLLVLELSRPAGELC